MNKELFASMREQMAPSGEARAALEEKLTAPQKKHIPVGRYAAIAACVAVVIAAPRVYNFVRDSREMSIDFGSFQPGSRVKVTEPHSYELADGAACWPADTTLAENSIDTGGSGDRDQDMTPGELADNMLEAGFTQDDVDAYLASGWQMTWSKWWKFYHQSEESGERTLEALLDFSHNEGLAVNTGDADVPGGAYVDQSEAIMAYQSLMDRFKMDYGPDKYPEWYGGAYIDEHAGLIVNIAEGYEAEDKELCYQIWDWADSDKVGFGSSRFSMNQLKNLQGEAIAAMEELGIAVGCGIDEQNGQVTLTLPEADEDALWALAYLDPAGTAIHVVVARTAAADTPAEEPVAPSVSHVIQPGGTPEMPDGAITDEDGVIAWEPQG